MKHTQDCPTHSGRPCDCGADAIPQEGERDALIECWHGDRKVSVYEDVVLRVWGSNIEDEMSDEPRSLRSVQAAMDWLYTERTAQPATVSASSEASVDLPEPAFRLSWRAGAYYVSKPNIDSTDCYTAKQMLAFRAGPTPANVSDSGAEPRMVEALEMIRDWPMDWQDWQFAARTMAAMAKKVLTDRASTARKANPEKPLRSPYDHPEYQIFRQTWSKEWS